MNIPILSKSSRKYGTKKAEVEVKKMQDATLLAEQGAELEYRNAKMELDNAVKVFDSSKMSLKLAEDIYKTSEIKFKEGVGSSTDLTTNNNQLLEAQGAYVQSMLKLLQAKNRLAKALNQY
jgi:outer membrane protein